MVTGRLVARSRVGEQVSKRPMAVGRSIGPALERPRAGDANPHLQLPTEEAEGRIGRLGVADIQDQDPDIVVLTETWATFPHETGQIIGPARQPSAAGPDEGNDRWRQAVLQPPRAKVARIRWWVWRGSRERKYRYRLRPAIR